MSEYCSVIKGLAMHNEYFDTQTPACKRIAELQEQLATKNKYIKELESIEVFVELAKYGSKIVELQELVKELTERVRGLTIKKGLATIAHDGRERSTHFRQLAIQRADKISHLNKEIEQLKKELNK